MKRIIPIIIGTLAITACGGTKTVYVNTTEAPDTTVKVVKTTDAPIATPAPTQPPVTWTEEDEFLYDIETSYYGTIYVSDYEMISTGRLVCDSLLGGMSGEEVIWAVVQAGGDTEFVTTVVSSAVVNFCPSQIYKFENL
jgi:hypothetical protein